MTDNHKYRLKTLMQKYLDRTCSEEERNELVEMIGKTLGAVEMDDLWREVWVETEGSDRLDDLSWKTLQDLHKTSNGNHIRVVWKEVWKWSAVAATMLLCIYFVIDWTMKGDDLMVYETGFGERLEIILEDGTKVNLNADSKLSWDMDWERNGLRKISLEGEAFFDVSHIDSPKKESELDGSQWLDTSIRMPFEVLTADVTIRVLGTAFNASQRRGKTEVFLERGSVELALHQEEKQNKGEKYRSTGEDMTHPELKSDHHTGRESPELLLMRPGDYVSFSSSEEVLVQKTIAAPEKPSEWKEGVLSYQDEDFQTMLHDLEDIYGKRFEVNDQELLDKRVNFSVPYEDWSTVKEMMKWMLAIEIMESGDDHIQIKKQKRD